jgi:SRSO17 transposase
LILLSFCPLPSALCLFFGNFTEGVGRQYIGEIGKTDNGIVVVTTHLYDGRKSLPLDIELYQHANSFPSGKKDPEFEKKTELAIKLIDRSRARGYQPGIVIKVGKQNFEHFY